MRKKWDDLPAQTQRFIVIGAVIELWSKLMMWRSVARTPRSELRGPKTLWILLSFVNGFGPATYFAIARRRSAAPRDQDGPANQQTTE